MSYVRTLGFVTLLLSLIMGIAPSGAAGINSPDDVFQLRADRAENGGVKMTWRIAPGHYLYRDKIKAAVDGRPVKVETAPGTRQDDPSFGLTEVYFQSAEASVAPEDLPAKGGLIVTYRGCQKDVICYPPVRKAIDLTTLLISDANAAGADPAPRSKLAEGFQSFSALPASRSVMRADIAPSSANLDSKSPALGSGSLLSQLLTFFGLGVLLSLTPCVFPCDSSHTKSALEIRNRQDGSHEFEPRGIPGPGASVSSRAS